MSTYSAEAAWSRGTASAADFAAGRYSRKHALRFDGGVEIDASSSPQNVPMPYSDAAAVDPEEAFVAALSSCHLLWFLALAARQGYCVDAYEDAATGVLDRNGQGRLAMTVVTLRPAVVFSGAKQPGRDDLHRLHHEAHEACYIANSVTTDVRCEPRYTEAGTDPDTGAPAEPATSA